MSYTFSCPSCNGTGSTTYGMCVDCAGRGFLVSTDGGRAQPPSDAFGCPSCRGTGSTTYGMCVDCGGKGTINYQR